FIALAALAMGILNCFHVFGLPAATPVLLNVSTIAFSVGIVWHYVGDPAKSLAIGVLVGGVLQFLIQVPSLVRRGMKFSFGISFSHPAIRDVARLMLPRLFGIGIGQINLLIDTRFATAARMPPGSLAALYLADRVMELVLGGYAIAVATAILPMMSHQAAAKDYLGLKKTLAFSVRIVAFITIPAMLGLMILREPIIRVLFQHGQFLALSTGLACYFDFFALFFIFRLRYGRLGIREILSSFAKISLCSGIMGIACWLGAHYTRFTIHSRFLVQLLVFVGLLAGATGLY